MDSLAVATKTLFTADNIQKILIGVIIVIIATIIIWIGRLIFQGKFKIIFVGEFIHTIKKRTKRSSALCNELILCLDKSIYNHGYSTNEKEPLYPNYEYSSVKLSEELNSNLSDFFRPNKNPEYEEHAKRSGYKSKNVVLDELNNEFPIIYERLYNLFNRGFCNKKEVVKCF